MRARYLGCGTERLRDIQIVGQRDWKTFRHYNKEIEGHSSIETKRFMEIQKVGQRD